MLEEFSEFEKLRRQYKCEDCRSCSVCQEKFIDKRRSIICTGCVKVFHLECHSPPLMQSKFREAATRRNWKCKTCQVNIIDEKEDDSSDEEVIGKEVSRVFSDTSRMRPPVYKYSEERKTSSVMMLNRKLSSVTNGSPEKLSIDNKMKIPKLEIEKDNQMIEKPVEANGVYNILEKIELPNVKNWNVDQVTEYMRKYFPGEAHVFKEHEIDGASLLLMRRGDVVKKLSLKLGPSLRIYSLVLKIQTQSNDPTLGWNCSK